MLFSLSPCIVKEALFNVAPAGYAKPLNKSKTNSRTGSCLYSQVRQQISTGKEQKSKKQTESVDVYFNRNGVIRSFKIQGKYSRTFSGNSPPKYILYKRLKLDIA